MLKKNEIFGNEIHDENVAFKLQETQITNHSISNVKKMKSGNDFKIHQIPNISSSLNSSKVDSIDTPSIYQYDSKNIKRFKITSIERKRYRIEFKIIIPTVIPIICRLIFNYQSTTKSEESIVVVSSLIISRIRMHIIVNKTLKSLMKLTKMKTLLIKVIRLRSVNNLKTVLTNPHRLKSSLIAKRGSSKIQNSKEIQKLCSMSKFSLCNK